MAEAIADAVAEPGKAITTTNSSSDTDSRTDAVVVSPSALSAPASGPAVKGDKGPTPLADTDADAGWPADWREKMAAGDDKALKRLTRYRTPDSVAKALLAADQKINSGAIHEGIPFPIGGPESEQMAWRRANGVPETPAGYHGQLDGIVIGAADRPLIDDFLHAAHAGHQTASQVRDTIDWYYRAQEALAADKAEADRAFRAEAELGLREAMGPEFRRNMQDLRNWLGTGPGRDADADPLAGDADSMNFPDLLFGARLADGTLLGDNPRVLRFLTHAMREINPLTTVVPSAGADNIATISEEIAAIENRIRDDRKGYHADAEMKARYRELLEARDRAGRTG